MISPADPYIASFAGAGADLITIHAEAGPHLDRSLQSVAHSASALAWRSIRQPRQAPLRSVIDRIDLVLVMTVNPGFGGQAFIPAMIGKVRQVKAMTAGRDIDVEVDGGIAPDTAAAVVSAGANILVAGAALFRGGAEHYGQLAALRRAAEAVAGQWT